jgi:integrase
MDFKRVSGKRKGQGEFMRVFRTSYKGKDGQKRIAARWYVDFTDHLQRRQRWPAFVDKRQSETFGRQIEQLVNCRLAGERPDAQLLRWLENCPQQLRTKLVKVGLLDSYQAAGGKPLAEHLADFEKYLLAKGDTVTHVKLILARTKRVIENCKFRSWSDISANKAQVYLANLRNNGSGISAQTFNFYLQAIKQFCRWMVQERRASENPLQYLKRLNVRTDRRHDRRALEPDEIRRLLEATQAAGTRFGMDGYQRALLYRLAIETGLRANELRNLRVGSFDLERCTVTVESQHTKNHKEAVLPLRADAAAELKQFFADKLPNVKAFGGTYKRLTDKTHLLIQADLQAAGISYVDESGRYADFHSLRHTTGSLLAASGVHPKVCQSIMRHSDINLTMSRYTHIFRGQESQAVESLPLFLTGQKQASVKTGTDNVDIASPQGKNFANSFAKQCALAGTTLENAGQTSRNNESENAFSSAPERTRTSNRRFRRPTLYPLELQAQPSLSSRPTTDRKTNPSCYIPGRVKSYPESPRVSSTNRKRRLEQSMWVEKRTCVSFI